jgi:RHS repeat-associated protein
MAKGWRIWAAAGWVAASAVISATLAAFARLPTCATLAALVRLPRLATLGALTALATLVTWAVAPVGAGAATLDADAAGAVWIADARGLLKLDAVRADLVLEVAGAPGTRALAVDRDAGVLWAYGGGELRAFDLGGRALFAVPVAPAPPALADGGIAAVAAGARPTTMGAVAAVAGAGVVWVADGARLLAFDETGQAVRSLSLGAPVRGLALDVERGLLWAATAGRVVAYGSGDGYERLELALGERPDVVGIAADAMTGSVWVAHADRLQRHGADGLRQLEVAGDAAQPLLAVAADGAAGVWIAGGRWLAHVDAAGQVGAPVGPFAGRGTIREMAVDPRRGDVWVAGQSELARLSAAGAVVKQLSFEPPLSILDLALDPGAAGKGRAGGGAVERQDGAAGGARVLPRGAAGAAVPAGAAAAVVAAAGNDAPAGAGGKRAPAGAGDEARQAAAPRDAPGPNATVVTGTVVLPDGAVLAGAAVKILGQPAVSATTAADGTFSISNVAAAAGLTLTVTVVAAAPTGQTVYAFYGVPAVPGGTSEAGQVFLAFACSEDFSNGLFPASSLGGGNVNALASFGSGLVAAGTFTSALIGGVNTSSVNRIAAWNGTTWAKLGTGIAGGTAPAVAALAVFGGQLYAGGTFTSAGGVTVANVARWNGSAWSAVGSGLPGTVEALGVWNGTLYAGGSFTTSGSVHFNHVAAWNGTAWVPVGAGFGSDVLALTSFDDGSGSGPQLYAGGEFASGGLDGVARWNAAANPAAWVAVGGGVTGTSTPLVDAFAAATVGGVPTLYAGGSFTAAGGVTAAGVAQWQAGAWSAAATNEESGAPGLANRVYALGILDDGYGPFLYAAGNFGSPYNRLAYWQAGSDNSWEQLIGSTGTAGADNTVDALAVWAPAASPAPPLEMYAGGTFAHAGGYTSTRMAQWGVGLTCTDTVPPMLAVAAPAYGAATNCSRPSLEIAYLDVGGGVKTSTLEVLANGQPLAASCTFASGVATCVPASAMADGVYTLSASAADMAGNDAYEYTTGLFIVDSVPPQVSVTVPAEGQTVPSSQGIHLAWSDASAGVNPQSAALQLNGGALAATCAADAAGAVCTPVQPLPAGAATLTAAITDLAGNAAISAARHFTVANTATAVIGSVVMADGSPAAGAQVAILGQGAPAGTTAADGTFSLAGVAAEAGQTLTVTAAKTVGGALLLGVAANLTPVLGGTTAAGVITLLPSCGPRFLDGLFPGTGVAGDPSVALYLPGGVDPHRDVQGLLGFDQGTGGGQALYAWGDFGYAGGRIISTVAWWDGAGWHELGQLAGAFGLAAADLGSGPALYALGGQTLIDQGMAMRGLAQWTGEEWVSVGGGTNGTVTALTAFDDGSGPALFIAGSFQQVAYERFWNGQSQAIAAPGTAKWNGTAWTAVPATATGSVNQFAVYGGTLYGLVIAGTEGGSDLYQWTGSAWSLVRNFSEGVAALASIASGGAGPAGLYVADPPGVERWDGGSWSTISPAAGQANAAALFGFDDGSGGGAKLYLAGSFCAASCATPPTGVFVWAGGTSWTAVGVNPDTAKEGPTVLAAWNDGTANRLVAGGQFLRTAQGLQANGVEELVGGALVPLGSQTVQGVAPMVRSMIVWDDGTGPALYVGGAFSSVGGVAANGIARWDGTRWSALRGGIGTGKPTDFVAALEVFNGALYAGGFFAVADGQPAANVARWDGFHWSAVGSGMDGIVHALRAWNGLLYAGGDFTNGGSTPRVAQWDGTQWSGLLAGIDGTRSSAGLAVSVAALAVYGGALYAAGNFASASGVAANGVARWDGASWSGIGGPSPALDEIQALAVYDDGAGPQLFLGGYWSDPTGSSTAAYLASWDGANLNVLATPDYGINSLAVFDDGTGFGPALYLGGSFRNLPGVGPANRFARYHQGELTAFLPGAYGSVVAPPPGTEGSAENTGVLAMAVFDDRSGTGPALFLGGDFTGAGGTNSSALAKWYAPIGCQDVIPPRITVSAPANGAVTRQASQAVTGAVNKAVTLTLDGAPVTVGGNLAFSTAVTLVEGANELLLAASDGFGGTAQAALTVTLDTVAPQLFWSAPAAGSAVGSATPALRLAYQDGGSGVVPATLAVRAGSAALAVTCTFGAAGALCVPNQPLAAGSVTLAATVEDGAGNVSAPATVTFTVNPVAGGGQTTVTGTVELAAGTPVGGAQVSVLGKVGPPPSGTSGTSAMTATTAADGSFAIGGVDVSSGAPLDVAAHAQTAAGPLSGAVTGVAPQPGGTTDVGVVRLSAPCAGAVGTPVLSEVGIDGGGRRVLALAVFDDGQGGGPALYAGGDFAQAGGVPAANLARWNGRGWTAVGGGTNGAVRALAVYDDGSGGGPALYAGGDFTAAGGAAAVNGVARWNGASWSALTGGSGGGSGVSGVQGSVYALAVYDDGLGGGPALYAGGAFSAAGGAAAANVARWRGGAWSAVGTGGGVDGTVYALASFGGRLVAGGAFGHAGGQTAPSLAQWNGSAWSAVAFGTDGTVYALEVWNGALYLGGDFTNAGLAQQPVYGIARWDGGSGWSGLAGGLSDEVLAGVAAPQEVQALAVFDDGAGAKLYATGQFMRGDAANLYQGAARWDGAAWTAVGSGFDMQGYGGAALAVFDDGSGAGAMLYAGGGFNTAGGLGAHQVARWNGKTWGVFGSGGTGADAGVAALAVFDDGAGAGPALYAGGDFTTVAGLAAGHAARWDATLWSQLGAGTDARVASLAALAAPAALYAGGDFAHAGGMAAAYLAAWPAAAGGAGSGGGGSGGSGDAAPLWSPVGAGAGASVRVVAALDAFGSGVAALYAGGDFASPGAHVASWNGSAWSPLGGGVDATVRALAAYQPAGQAAALYAGGDFQNAGGSVAAGVARWDGASWSAAGGGVAALAGVYALAVFDDGAGGGPALYAGGASSGGGGGGGGGAIFRWSGGAWTAVGGGFNGPVAALAVFDDGGNGGQPVLYAGGSFTAVGGVAAPGLARWSGTSWLPVVVGGAGAGGGGGSGGSPVLAAGSVAALAVWDDGGGPALWVGGDFYLGSPAAGGVTHAYLVKWSRALSCADGTPPTLAFTAPAESATVASTTPELDLAYSAAGADADPGTLAITANGAAAAMSCVAGAGGAGTLACTPAAPLPAGAVRLAATIANLSGAVSAPAVLDIVVPALALRFTAPAEGATLSSLTPELDLAFSPAGDDVVASSLALTANGAAAAVSCVTGAGGAGTLACTPAAPLPAGAVRLAATIADGSGAVSAPAILDVVAPALTLSFTAPAEGSWVASATPALGLAYSVPQGDSAATGSLALTSGGAALAVNCTFGGAAASAQCTPAAPLPEGAVHLAATMADGAGQVSSPATLDFSIDTTPPALSFTQPAAGAVLATTTPTVALTYGDGGSGVNLAAVKIWATGTVTSSFTCSLQAGAASCQPAAPVGDGRFTFTATAADNAGNISPQASLTFTVDTLPPVLAFVWPAAGGAANSTTPGIILAYSDAGTGVDVTTLQMTANGAALPVSCSFGVTGATCTPTAPFAAGPVTVQATVADHAGHVSAVASVTFQILLDSTPPVITLAAPAPGALVNQPSQMLSGQLSKPATLTVTLNGGAPAAVQANNSFTYGPVTLAEGANALALTATDVVGNVGKLAATVTLDSVPPVISINAPQANTYFDQASQLLLLAWSDSGTGVDPSTLVLTANGQPLTTSCQSSPTGATCATSSLPVGGVLLSAVVSDRAGNAAPAATVSFSTDVATVAPVITLLAPPAGSTVSTPQVTLAGTLSKMAALTFDGQAYPVNADLSWSIGPVGLAPGANSFTLRATDGGGLVGSLAFNLTLDTAPPETGDPGEVSVVEQALGLQSVAAPAGWATPELGEQVVVRNLATGLEVRQALGAAGGFQVNAAAMPGDVLRVWLVNVAGTASPSQDLTAQGRTPAPQDPAAVAPPLDGTTTQSTCSLAAFLWAATPPVQFGVQAASVDCARLAVVHGTVSDPAGTPISGARVSVDGQPEMGFTLTRPDGAYDLALAGGARVVLQFSNSGSLSAQRTVQLNWGEFAALPQVVLATPDSHATAIDLTQQQGVQVARGGVVSDAAGTRQATLLFGGGTTAQMVLPGGSAQALTSLTVRATECSTGPLGPRAVPATLTPGTTYAYAADLSVDAAAAAGASSVQFSQVVPFYLENYLGLAVGQAVNASWYDREQTAWMPAPSGLVVQILSVTGGAANLDVDGGGQPAAAAALAALGVTDAERQQLASLYAVGQSLWRVPLTHFSLFDFAWTTGSLVGGAPQPVVVLPTAGDDSKIDHPAESLDAGLLEGDNQILGQSLDVAGTPFSLSYRSDRVAGRTAPYTLHVPLTPAILPPGFTAVQLEIDIAGADFVQTFAATPALSYDFIWNRQDGFGRQIQGPAPWTATITYLSGGVALAGESAKFAGELGGFDARSIEGMGGWTLSAHHFYDLSTGTLYFGDGSRRSLESDLTQPKVLNVVAGTGFDGGGGDNGQARVAQLSQPAGLSVMHDGSLLIADLGTCRVRKVATDGIITTVAGTGCTDDGTAGTGDGGPATAAVLGYPMKAIEGPAPQYPIYIADQTGNRIRRVDANGTITTAAGTGQWGCTGNRVAYPADLALDTAGNLLIVNWGLLGDGDGSGTTPCDSVVRMAPGGGLTTVVGFQYNPDPAKYSSPAFLEQPLGVAAGTDGSVYITPIDALLRMPPGGGVDPLHEDWVIAGIPRVYFNDEVTFAGDGLPASEAVTRFLLTQHLAVAPDGSIYVVDRLNGRVRAISPAGIVSTVAGGGILIPSGDGLPAGQAALQQPFGVALDSTGSTLYISDIALHQVWKLVLPGAQAAANQRIPSEDSSLLYVFDAQGHHLSTQTAITGKTLLTFSYTDYPQPSAAAKHLLTQITDAAGNVTTIQRGGDGTATAVVAPFGQTTNLAYDGNGYLSSVTRNGETVQLTHDSSGLLDSLIDPLSGSYSFSFDSIGQLTGTADPAAGGAAVALDSSTATSRVVGETSAMGLRSKVELDLSVDQPNVAAALPPGVLLQQTVTDPASLQVQTSQMTNGQIVTSYPDGTSVTAQMLPDPFYRSLAPYPLVTLLQTPSGRQQVLTEDRQVSFTPDGSQIVTWSLASSFNGRVTTTAVDNTEQTVTTTSPAGRTAVTQLDSLGRAAQEQVSGVDPVSYTYDGNGRLASVKQGARTTAYAYGADGFLASAQDALGRTVSYQHDPVGRVTQEILPDGRVVAFAYDAAGDLTSITPPSRPAHAFGYDPVSDVSSYAPPALTSGATPTAYTYDDDHRLTTITRPDQQTIALAYDGAGRLAGVTTPEGAASYAYGALDGKLQSITAPAGGGAISYTYDGPLTTAITATGPAPGMVKLAYDTEDASGSSNFWLTTRTINGDAASALSFSYDNDGLLIQAGSLQLFPDPGNGLLTGTQLLATADQISRSEYGEVSRYQAAFNDGTCTPPTGPPPLGCFNVLDQTFQRDAAGRITQKTETLRDPITAETSTHVYQYTFDPAGQLTAVTLDGAAWESYAYDANGNRTSWTDPWGSGAAAYDAQDRLLTAGSLTYTYTANGELLTRSQNGQTDTFGYDAMGNLRSVALASGVQITYLIDALNRRAGTVINGVQASGLLYGNGAQPLAQLDGAGHVVATFLYGTGNAPDAILQDGVTYRLLKDHLGSVRWVINALTGEVAEHLDYDAFGRVILDTNPGLQPFGFAGGLYDAQTGLVHFGARDYDPATGRWVSKDPIGFDGGSTGLYVYVGNDPVNQVDPDGRAVGEPGFWEGLIPVWGAGRASINDFQAGDFGWGTLNAVLAVSDVALVRSLGTAAGKGLWKLGSHTWPATSKWLTKVGWREFVGQDMHHWLIPQRQWGKVIPEWLKNQPFNLKPMSSKLLHQAIENKGGAQLSILERIWRGSPGWSKLVLGDAAGHVVTQSHNADAGDP